MIPIADGMPRDMRIIFGKPEELSISQFGKVANVQDRQVDLLRLLQTLICSCSSKMKILMDNLTRKVSELRKRVEESRRRLCAKKDEMNQLDQAVEKKENEVRRLHSAMASVGGRGLSPRASGNQPVNFYRPGSNNHPEAVPLFSSQQPAFAGGFNPWAGVSSSQGGERRGGVDANITQPFFS